MMKSFNKTYIYIGSAILALIIIISCVLILAFKPTSITYTTLIATDGSFCVDFPTNISYVTNNQENNEFVIDLYSSEEEMFFYATKISKIREIDFASVVHKDKENYLKDKENIQEDSGIVPFSLPNHTAYEYHFVYNDSSYGKDFYCNVLWVETEHNLYILNLEVVNENKEKFEEIFERIKSSFVEL